MLTALRLGHFKAFAETQRMPIRPLTLIFGANSSGKSSLIHGLLLAHHASETGELDVHRTRIGGDSVDLGGFRQFIHQRDAKHQVELTLEISKSSFTRRLQEVLSELEEVSVGLTLGLSKYDKSLLGLLGDFTPNELFEALREDAKAKGEDFDEEKVQKEISDDFITFKEKSLIEGDVHVETFWIESGAQHLLSMSYRSGGYLQLDSLDTEHTVAQNIMHSIVEAHTTSLRVDDLDIKVMTEAVDELVPRISFEIDKFFPSKLRKEEGKIESSEDVAISPISRDRRAEDLGRAIDYYLPRILQDTVLDLSRLAEKELARLIYLGPLRSYPPRHIAFAQHHDPNWHPGGGHTWDIIRVDPELRSVVNDWLGDLEKLSTHYEVRVRNLLTIEDIESRYDLLSHQTIRELEDRFVHDEVVDLFGELEEKVGDLPEKLKIFEPFLTAIQEVVLFDKRTKTMVSHRDVGIGISQVLPVLVTALAARNRIVAIEQPEIHLHPALQAELGDVFIESALGERKNTFLIETHSEHLILRLLKRIRETTKETNVKTPPIQPEHVALLFVDVTGTGSSIQQLRIDKRGRLIDPCPGGFFEEDFEELF
jgi:predicted ATPase